MTSDELDKLLSARPVGFQEPPRERLPEKTTQGSQSDLKSIVGAIVSQQCPSPLSRAEKDARRAAREAEEARIYAVERAERLAKNRAELELRISEKLLAELKKVDTCCAVLLGPTGIGKTSAAWWSKVKWGGMFVTARELGACERRHSLGDGEPELLKKTCTAEHLYIDDIGTEDPRDLRVIQNVIDERYSRCLATHVTTGMTKSGLSNYLSPPFVRRLIEQHAGHKVLVVDCHE